MSEFSVVIVCKNEADVIAGTLQSLAGLTDDIVVYDNGSTDGTQQIIKQFDVRLHEGTWEGFGKTKNKAIRLAKHDWILSLDADEALDETLKQSLLSWTLPGEQTVFDIPFKNFLGNKYVKYGEWGGDHHIRLFNRNQVRWDEAPVHESLVLPADAVTKKLKGYVLHRTMGNMEDYITKMMHYALLNAEKYFRQGKKATWFKIRLSPGFTFFNYFILQRGFLDGHTGYVCAKMTAYYTFLKYARLRELSQQITVGSAQSAVRSSHSEQTS
ncbi:MAG: glycosyltransferase family 2 protein [Chitinophagaceae bacterium]|nr:glycosyltransferase family 2 protein [Chitinophagaceae bacterium]MBL0130925.1 glycosyltransferase family 2 protein [Chitinophagaceae bacterium]MBL0272775.1 glycosyltransferase family 2 protein [Chitinophagaceae bacterium]